MREDYRSFVIPGIRQVEIDSYVDQATPYIQALIEDQLKEMQSTKVIMKLWVIEKKLAISAITLDSEDAEGPQDIGDNTGDNYIKVEQSFNRLMAESFEGSNIEEVIQHIFEHITMQVEIARMPQKSLL